MFLAFRICARPIFSEKGKDIFLFGVLPSKYSGSVAGLQFGLGKTEKLFSGERIFRFASANLFFAFCPRGGGVWGGIRAGLDFVFGDFKKENKTDKMNLLMELLRDFKKISKNDVSLAGGKGASLGEMIQADISVPPGFVILADAFEKFLKETDLNIEIDSILDSVNHKEIHTIENASEKIKSLILQAEMPQDIAAETQKFFKNLSSKYVAVRSSATAEDSASAAWAGQLESYLNTTEENLLENIKKCWASLFTPRAIFYRFEKDLHKQKISVAVVVQKMIESEKSGIAFSVHPVTQDHNQLIIEAGLGLGEAIVSGEITPDSYVVEKQPRRIIDKNIQAQKSVLSDKEILELSELVLKIEKHFGFPCDIEWAFEKDKIFIVQSRPITTLSSRPFIRKFQKFFAREIPLVVMEYWHQGEYKELYKILNRATHFNPLFIRNQNRLTDVFYDMNNPDTALQPLFDYFKNNPNRFGLLVEEFGVKQKEISKLLDNFEAESFSKLFNAIAEAWGYLPIWTQFGSTDKKDIVPDMIETSYKLRDQFQEIEYKVGEVLLSSIKTEYPKLKEYADVISAQEIINNKIPDLVELKQRKNGFVFFEEQILPKITKEEFAKKYQVVLVDDLATIGEFDPSTLLILEGKMIFVAKRYTNPFEASLRVKSWSDSLEKELGFGYKAVVINSDGEYFVDSESENKITEVLKLKTIKDALDYIGKMYDLKNNLLAKITGKNYSKIEQDFSALYAYFFIARRISENMYEKSNSKDRKIIESWRSDDTLFEPLDLYNKINPQNDFNGDWSIVFNNGGIYRIDKKLTWQEKEAEEVDNIIKGKTAYPGLVRGKVRLITLKDDLNTIRDGEILVTNMTTPEFVPALKKVAAFITDEGGITSHAAITAREMKKPCIIGTKNATKKLKDGDEVEVDANNGIIRILK